jgi:hypothetical protein
VAADLPRVDGDATLYAAAFDLSASEGWSAEARTVFLTRFTNNAYRTIAGFFDPNLLPGVS